MSNITNAKFAKIANTYSLAFVELAQKHGVLDSFKDELISVNSVFSAEQGLMDVLKHPIVSVKEKLDILDTIFTGLLSPLVLNSLKILVENNRIDVFSAIVEQYITKLNKIRNVAVVKVTTAIEIDDEVRQRVKDRIQSIISKNVVIDSVIDKNIIAGMIIQMDDNVIDGSIRTKLENMKKQFA